MSDGISTEGALLEVSFDEGANYDPVLERSQMRNPKTTETIDFTSFDSDGFRDRGPGLRTIDVEASGNYVPADGVLDDLNTAWLDGDRVHVRASWRTSAPGDPETRRGWTIPGCTITDLGEGGNVGDKVELSLKFAGGGRPEEYTSP